MLKASLGCWTFNSLKIETFYQWFDMIASAESSATSSLEQWKIPGELVIAKSGDPRSLDAKIPSAPEAPSVLDRSSKKILEPGHYLVYYRLSDEDGSFAALFCLTEKFVALKSVLGHYRYKRISPLVKRSKIKGRTRAGSTHQKVCLFIFPVDNIG